MVLGITDTLNQKFADYENWVRRLDGNIVVKKLSSDEDPADLERCDGLILTGGSDIHPKFYGQQDFNGVIETPNVKRDEFELAVAKRAGENRMPVLGICRGMQVFNVAHSGTMIHDIGDGVHRVKASKEDVYHPVKITDGTVLHSIARATEGIVNSRHHQAVDRIGDRLRIASRSMDGKVVESLEWDDPSGRPFLILVQWHPERMKEFESPFSKGLLERFVNEVQSSKSVETTSRLSYQ